MDHLGAGIGLLAIVGHRDRIEFADRSIAREHAARIFPRNCTAGLDLRPADLTVPALAQGKVTKGPNNCLLIDRG